MNRDDIIKLAREAHVVPYIVGPSNKEYIGRLESFAKLVAAAEREDCAKFFEMNDTNLFWGSQAAQHIRARGTP